MMERMALGARVTGTLAHACGPADKQQVDGCGPRRREQELTIALFPAARPVPENAAQPSSTAGRAAGQGSAGSAHGGLAPEAGPRARP